MSRGGTIAPSQSLPSEAWSSPTTFDDVLEVTHDRFGASAAQRIAEERASGT